MKQTWNTLAKARMKELGISQEKLGELIGKTQGAVAHWLNGRREPGLDDITSIMRVLKIDKVDLLADGSVTSSSESFEYVGKPRDGLIPVVGEALMGTDGEFEMCEELAGWLRIYSSDPDAFSLRVKGDSMFPRINSGEYVVVEPKTHVHPGDEVFIRTSQGKNMIKRLGYHREEVYQFISVNQQHPPLTLDNTEVDKVYFVAAIVKSSRYIDSTSDLNLHA
ncbi:helix-turn-helix transcriptional regulator [Serratia symbiotica]|uniref:LexA family transcriptional regulator n=1 Tax=Serratia symbiotica TaxID=138074 RepID=UPI001887F69C|nr:LexA family transcriptional regulator [Serratia symbiotica]MBF1995621.1 helix-turn-helix transcriptional regulator [Serratia symbiotica]